jgi:hypothetical protein
VTVVAFGREQGVNEEECQEQLEPAYRLVSAAFLAVLVYPECCMTCFVAVAQRSGSEMPLQAKKGPWGFSRSFRRDWARSHHGMEHVALLERYNGCCPPMVVEGCPASEMGIRR